MKKRRSDTQWDGIVKLFRKETCNEQDLEYALYRMCFATEYSLDQAEDRIVMSEGKWHAVAEFLADKSCWTTSKTSFGAVAMSRTS